VNLRRAGDGCRASRFERRTINFDCTVGNARASCFPLRRRKEIWPRASRLARRKTTRRARRHAERSTGSNGGAGGGSGKSDIGVSISGGKSEEYGFRPRRLENPNSIFLWRNQTRPSANRDVLIDPLWFEPRSEFCGPSRPEQKTRSNFCFEARLHSAKREHAEFETARRKLDFEFFRIIRRCGRAPDGGGSFLAATFTKGGSEYPPTLIAEHVEGEVYFVCGDSERTDRWTAFQLVKGIDEQTGCEMRCMRLRSGNFSLRKSTARRLIWKRS